MRHIPLNPTRPTVDKVLPSVRALYRSEGGGAGCCLHCALDDGNLGTSGLEGDLETAIDRGHLLCADIACKMLRMTMTQRKALVERKRK